MVIDDLAGPEIAEFLAGHLTDMHAQSPPDSVHALDLAALRAPEVTVWTVRDGSGVLVGCGALKELDPAGGEIKSMRTAPHVRGRGIAAGVLEHLVATGRERGYRTLSLETGSMEFFAPARRLYARHGFVPCPPFGDYTEDPNSVFMRLDLGERAATPAG
ncbi:GNAT family N-acetyltransferase [Pseudonocardia sp. HH130630-07]|uniref:GNAT family N-acetyltransferase n=1 Tax=Pseudonocardia sp. HH130630-07 TaxID=1690815 RepID=UPI000814E54A|nr:GNAT family N-acetyltransferase [Pseudonocardia sp. HH130630-07]ANY10397.1 GCN5 family acetyltransferase [Pseudonocardia sp. HH130630-07]